MLSRENNVVDAAVSCQDDLLKVRWKQMTADSTSKDVDFIVKLIFHKWERLAKVLPKGCQRTGLPHYSTGDIQRIYRDYKSYQERCRVALVEWIDCSATENGLQLLIQALKDADMGKEAEKVLKEFGTPAGTDQNGDYLDMRNIPAVEESMLSVHVPMLRCIPNSNLQLLPSHPSSKGSLGPDTTCASWHGTLVAVHHRPEHQCTTYHNRRVALDTLRKEYAALSLLRHPNITCIYGFHIPETGSAGVVMELMTTTLHLHCQSNPKLIFADVLPILTGVVSALCWMHTYGVVHSRLNSKYVYLSMSADSRYPLAKIGGPMERWGRNTAHYTNFNFRFSSNSRPSHNSESMPHQHAEDMTSIYAVGVMAVEALLGVEAFEDTPQQWIVALRRLGIDARFTHILSKCLEETPLLRPTSAELLRRLEEADILHIYDNGVAQRIAISRQVLTEDYVPMQSSAVNGNIGEPYGRSAPRRSSSQDEVFSLRNEVKRMENELSQLRRPSPTVTPAPEMETSLHKKSNTELPAISVSIDVPDLPNEEAVNEAPPDHVQTERPQNIYEVENETTDSAGYAVPRQTRQSSRRFKTLLSVAGLSESSRYDEARGKDQLEVRQSQDTTSHRRALYQSRRGSSPAALSTDKPLSPRLLARSPKSPRLSASPGSKGGDTAFPLFSSGQATDSATQSSNHTPSPVLGKSEGWRGARLWHAQFRRKSMPVTDTHHIQVLPSNDSGAFLSAGQNCQSVENISGRSTPVVPGKGEDRTSGASELKKVLRRSFRRKKAPAAGSHVQPPEEPAASHTHEDHKVASAALWKKVRSRAKSAGSFKKKKTAEESFTDQQKRARSEGDGLTIVKRQTDPNLVRAAALALANSLMSINNDAEPGRPAGNRVLSGVKCVACRSHHSVDASELSIRCGEPLVVFEEVDPRTNVTKYTARSSATGITGSISLDSFICLRQLKRTLHAYDFQEISSVERARVQYPLSKKLPPESFPRFCDELLGDECPEGGYEHISSHCREIGEDADEFDEMFKLWCRGKSANGLHYYDAAGVVDGYQSHVLQILQVLVSS